MRAFVCVLGAMIVLPTAAVAQEAGDAAADAKAKAASNPKFFYTVGLGGFSVADDTVTTPSGEEIGNDVSVYLAGSASLARKVTENVYIEGQFGIWSAQWDGLDDGSVSFFCPEDNCSDPELQTTSYTGNIVVTGSFDQTFRPYAGIGAGFFRSSLNLENVDGETGFGFLAKGGADFAVSPTGRLGVEAVYVGAPDAEFENFVDMPVAGYAVLATFTGQF